MMSMAAAIAARDMSDDCYISPQKPAPGLSVGCNIRHGVNHILRLLVDLSFELLIEFKISLWLALPTQSREAQWPWGTCEWFKLVIVNALATGITKFRFLKVY